VRHPSQGSTPPITTVDEYDGSSEVRISATQLGTRYSATQARKIVNDWCEFFAAGPSSITDLAFTSRTPKRLFASLLAQTQLRALAVKWGDYDDLRPLRGMHELTALWLGGASSLISLEPIAQLPQLRELAIESLRHVHDLSPLADLKELRALEVGGDWVAPRIVHVDSIGFLSRLNHLERLVLHTLIVDDLDYAPLLSLPSLKSVRVMEARRMTPPLAELVRQLPWDA
jgi:hypothetical protein